MAARRGTAEAKKPSLAGSPPKAFFGGAGAKAIHVARGGKGGVQFMDLPLTPAEKEVLGKAYPK